MIEDVCPLPGTGQNRPFPLLPTCPTVAKSLPVLRLETKKLLLSVDDVVGPELLATTIANKHLATVLPNYVLARRLQRLESLVTYITG